MQVKDIKITRRDTLDYLKENKISIRKFAQDIEHSYHTVWKVLNYSGNMSMELQVKFEKYFRGKQ